MSTTPRAGGHGSIIRSQFYGEKTITVPCVIEGSGWSDLLTKIDLVRGVLMGDMNNDHQLILGWQESRYINARVASVAMGEEYGTRAMKTEITFIAGDPTWYGVTAKTGAINSISWTYTWHGLNPETWRAVAQPEYIKVYGAMPNITNGTAGTPRPSRIKLYNSPS
jgi:predicted phage tail component-like protein